MDATDYQQGATVPPGKHHPFCDWSNLWPASGPGPGSQALVSAFVLSSALLTNNWWWFNLSHLTRTKENLPGRHLKAAGFLKPFPDWFYLYATLMARSQRECQRKNLHCCWSILLISKAGCFFIQEECAKLGWVIITVHLWALWTKIVHFPSESICRPIIRIILGKPVRVSSGHCIFWINLAEPPELPWTKTIAPQCNVNTKVILCCIPLSVTTASN